MTSTSSWVRFVSGVLLGASFISAGGLKIVAPAADASLPVTFLGAVEILMGLLLIAIPRRRLIARVCLWGLLAFTGYLLIGRLAGPADEVHCGCFGRVRVAFWQHIAINVVMMGLALVVSEGDAEVGPPAPLRG